MLFISQHNFRMIVRKEYFKEKNDTFINEYYDTHSAIILNNIGRPIYSYIDGEKDFKTCRFCGKTQDEVPFNNKSHVVPKFLGNFLVLSSSECDECNAFFSKYETELEKFIKIPLIINKQNNDLKNRYGQNLSRIGDDIITHGKQEIVQFNGIFVLKVFLKFAYGMLNEDELEQYKEIRNVLKNNEVPKITNILDITITNPEPINSVVLYSNKINDGKYSDNILTLNFNMKKICIFFNKDNSKITVDKDIIREEYIKLFNDIELNSSRTRNFNKENVRIRFNIDVFMELIKNGL